MEKNPAFIDAKLVIDHIKVVNDAAERGVKLAQDFQEAARKEKRYQNVLQAGVPKQGGMGGYIPSNNLAVSPPIV